MAVTTTKKSHAAITWACFVDTSSPHARQKCDHKVLETKVLLFLASTVEHLFPLVRHA